MNRLPLSFCLGVLLISACPLHAAQFKFPNQTITVPDGFEVELVADSSLVKRPVTADFDEQGRLYVTDSSGTNEKVDKQLQDKPHRVVRLEDTDGDGRFDKSALFADHMMFPEGCLWFNGSLYVSAPPSIWKLTDTDGDGVVDQREEWMQGKTLTGCANDLHGPYLGPDGWIYWCKGAFAKQTYPRPGKPPFVTRAAHIFRAQPDGTGIEPVLTGGMDNPVSVTFTPEGERILTGTFFVHPGGGQRDGLIHAIYGGVYGKDHDVIYDHKRTGDLMPIMTHHGPSASCFVLRYEGDQFGTDHRDNLFACLFNLHKVTRHVLEPDGATFKTRDEDFLVSDNPDFHPTDLVEDADGSLLVVDTGGWYKICCPTSQLWKPDVLGAIYRVRRSGAQKIEDPRGLKLPWAEATPEQLVQWLGDRRIAVQKRAIHALAQKKGAAVPALERVVQKGSTQTRLNAVWALTRIEGDAARQAVRLALSDSDATIRHATVHSVSVHRDRAALPQLLAALPDAPAPLQRVMAEALGRIGDTQAVPPLLAAASHKTDRVLEHSLIYALIEIDDSQAVRASLAARGQGSAGSFAQHAALIALDQMDNGGLTAAEVTPLLTSSDPLLRQTASWIISHRPEWAGALASFFRERLVDPHLSESDRSELESQIGNFGADAAIQELIAKSVRAEENSKLTRLTALHAMARAHVKEMPLGWATALTEVLGAHDPELIAAAVAAARALPAPKEGGSELAAALQALARKASVPPEVRLNALAAVPPAFNELDAVTFAFLRANLDPAKPVMTRSTAAAVLSRAKLTSEQLLALTDSVKTAGPLEVPKLLSAFEKGSGEDLGLRLIAALKQSPALSSLRAETLRLTNFPTRVQEEGAQLLASVNVDAAQEKAHVDELLHSLTGGDVRRGQAVFNSQKAACSSCHAIGYLGGNVGPDLTRIGQIRTERDLVEAIVYPSASFVRSYEPMLITTKSGDDFNGVVRKDGPDEIVLATGPGTEARIARSDIAEMRPGSVSVMPAGLEQQLTKQELADLIAFLKATRW